MFVRTIDSLYASINQFPWHVLGFYVISYLCVMHLFLSEEARYFLEKAVLILILYHIHSYVYIHFALCYQELYLQASFNNLAMPHSV